MVERKSKKKKPQVEEVGDTKPRSCKRVGVKRETVIIKTEQSKYSDVLKAMQSGAKLVDLEAETR